MWKVSICFIKQNFTQTILICKTRKGASEIYKTYKSLQVAAVVTLIHPNGSISHEYLTPISEEKRKVYLDKIQEI